MFKTTVPAFMPIPNSNSKRVLIEGKVSAVDAGTCSIEFETVAGLTPGGDVTLYAEVRGKFFQQAATVAGESYADGRTTVSFALVGEPVSAEQRGSFRTSAVMLDVPVGVDRITGCVLADVSPEGVAVISPKPLTLGAMVDVSLAVDGFVVSDRMKVQGAKVLPSGKLRFGLYVPGKGSPSRRTLEKLTGHLQRVQLRRLSGAA